MDLCVGKAQRRSRSRPETELQRSLRTKAPPPFGAQLHSARRSRNLPKKISVPRCAGINKHAASAGVRFRANPSPPELHEYKGQTIHESYGGESPGVYYIRLQRDGWKLVAHAEEGESDHYHTFTKPLRPALGDAFCQNLHTTHSIQNPGSQRIAHRVPILIWHCDRPQFTLLARK